MRPVLFTWNEISVLAYPVIIIAAILIAVFLIRYYEIPYLKAINRCPEPLEKYNGEALIIASVLILIGARLGFVITNWHLYVNNPAAILAFWRGGFAYHGGLIAVLFGVSIHAGIRHIPLGKLLDAAIPYASLAYGIGRLGCFLNGCCHGRETELPWGLVYPAVDSLPRHPAQLYASATSLIIFLILFIVHRNNYSAGYTFAWFLILHGCYRLAVDFFRVREYLWGNISLAQVISMAIILGGFVLLLNKINWRADYD